MKYRGLETYAGAIYFEGVLIADLRDVPGLSQCQRADFEEWIDHHSSEETGDMTDAEARFVKVSEKALGE